MNSTVVKAYITSSHAQVRQKSHREGEGGREVLLIVQEFLAKNKKLLGEKNPCLNPGRSIILQGMGPHWSAFRQENLNQWVEKKETTNLGG